MEDNNYLKNFYSGYNDRIIDKRLRSKHKLRRYAHVQQYKSLLKYVEPGVKVLDSGCGEGILSIMMARKGVRVIGSDISRPNIEKCEQVARKNNIDNIKFIVADSEKLPFPDNSFDLVVSSHVLEHLPDFDKGLLEIMRVTKKRAIIAIPTVLNLCSLAQVGGGWFYIKGKRSFLALPYGFLKMMWALITFKEGVDEGYEGKKELTHIFRFPWVMKRKLKKYGFKLVEYEAPSLCLPYFEFLLPIIKFLDKYRRNKFIRNFGYGTTYIIDRRDK